MRGQLNQAPSDIGFDAGGQHNSLLETILQNLSNPAFEHVQGCIDGGLPVDGFE
jgi:hypothetical protein